MACIIRSVLLGKCAVVAFLMLCVSAWPDEVSELRSQLRTLEERFERLERARARKRRLAPAAAVHTGARPRTWKLPGTNTSMEIGGYAKLDLIYDINASPGISALTFRQTLRRDNTPEGRQQGHFALLARESRLFVKTWTPTQLGELHTRIEGDFFGPTADEIVANSHPFRVRRAFGRLGPLLAGQDFSTFMILDAIGETIDFFGPAAVIFARQGVIRYTHSFGGGTTLSLAVENPSTGIEENRPFREVIPPLDIVIPLFDNGGPVTGPDGLPDFVVKLSHRWSSGGAGIAVLVRRLQIDNGGAPPRPVSDSVLGWGVHAGFGWRFNKKRTAIGGWFYYAQGGGRYTGIFPAAVLKRTQTGELRLETVESYGGTIWIQHRWTDTIRTNLHFSRVRLNIVNAVGSKAALSGYVGPFGLPAPQDIWTVHANIIWRPTQQVDIGLEYQYAFAGLVNTGPRPFGIVDGGNAKQHRITVMFKYWFMQPF